MHETMPENLSHRLFPLRLDMVAGAYYPSPCGHTWGSLPLGALARNDFPEVCGRNTQIFSILT